MTHHLIWLCLLCRWNTGSRTFEQNWIIGCQGWCPVGTRWALPMCPIAHTVWLWYRVNSCIAPNCPSGRLTHSSSVYGYSNENTVYSNVYSIQYTAMYTVYSYGWANQFFIFSIGICRLTLGCPIDFFLFTQLAMMSDLCSIFLNWHSICILQTHELDWSQSVKRQIDSILYLYKRHSPTIC